MTHETAVSADNTTEAEARATARALFADDTTREADVRDTTGALFGGTATTTTDAPQDDAEPAPRNLFALTNEGERS